MLVQPLWKRISLALVIAFALALCDVATDAVASRPATGKIRVAIEKAAAKGMSAGIPQSCLVARVTTIGGGNWATVALNLRRAACNLGNGIVVVHRVRDTWRFVDAGSSMPRTECQKDGIPIAVQHDLRIPCH